MAVGNFDTADTTARNQILDDIIIYNRALAQAEIRQQMTVIRPLWANDLYSFTPMFPGAVRVQDAGPRHNDWTATGALTDDLSTPGVNYDLPRIWWFYVPAGGNQALATVSSWQWSAAADLAVGKGLATASSWQWSAAADVAVGKALATINSWAWSGSGDLSGALIDGEMAVMMATPEMAVTVTTPEMAVMMATPEMAVTVT